jgi:NADH-quinone oxidoreductase subunit H
VAVVGRRFSRLPLPAKVFAVGLPVLLVAGILTVAVLIVALPLLVSAAEDNLPLVRFLVAVVAVLLLTVPTAFVVIYLELKLIARMNLRIGPDRVGPFGTAQSVIHGLKVLTKEDFTPSGADRLVFTWAPVVVFLATVMTLLVIPFAPGLFGADFNIGLLYVLAIAGLTVVGLLMAGWASFNKYSLLGGLRSAAQAISYEIPLSLSVVGVVILAGTLSLNQLVLNQAGSFLDWYVWQQPIGVLIFFIAATAEANRTPFDLTEADSEIVAGFATEYSGMRFGFFFFAEYVNVFVVAALLVTLFFGGWNAPFDWPWPVEAPLDPGSLGITLLFLVAVVPVVATVLLALPFWLGRSSTPFWQALVIGFVLFNIVAIAAVMGWAFVSFDWVVGLLWFMAKAYVFVFVLVWMRATLPRVRVDQLMGFAWKWLLPASLLNLFVTAAAVVVIAELQ